MRSKAAAILWLAWLGVAIWTTWPAFAWEIDYFPSPGPAFYRIVLVLLCVSPLLPAGWDRV